GDPRVAGMAEDVEALLVHRVRGARDAFLVSIDVCFEITGLVRAHWRGMSGGPELWQVIERFFGDLARWAPPPKIGRMCRPTRRRPRACSARRRPSSRSWRERSSRWGWRSSST